MEQKLFDELIASIEQAGEILHGECEPARSYNHCENDLDISNTQSSDE